jgi:hypothetical protein
MASRRVTLPLMRGQCVLIIPLWRLPRSVNGISLSGSVSPPGKDITPLATFAQLLKARFLEAVETARGSANRDWLC